MNGAFADRDLSRAAAFWGRVSLGETIACWPWNGARTVAGYGIAYVDGKQRMAHRVAWAFVYGRIPPGKMLLHSCDNPSCVNPRHLRPGTLEENALDRTVLTRVREVLEAASRLAVARASHARRLTARAQSERVPGGPDRIKYCHWVLGPGGSLVHELKHPTRRHANSFMTATGAQYIRDLYIVHGVDLRTIAKVCNVKEPLVRQILSRRTWSHLPPSPAEARAS